MYELTEVFNARRGLAVASRLSEDPSVTVAVIEAGPNVEDLPEVGISPQYTSGYPDIPTRFLSPAYSECPLVLHWIGSITLSLNRT